MYIQITNVCNMTCEHCCFACTNKGRFMSLEHFEAALKLAREYDESICIGGGEPTLHPDFEVFLIKAIASTTEERRVYIVTNGSIKERALLLARLTANHVIDARLSHDQYHNSGMVSDDVFNAFDKLNAFNGHGYIPSSNIMARGRGRNIKGAMKDCCCSDVFVRPNGGIYQCGCLNAPRIGHVLKGYNSPCAGECCHSEYYKRELALT